MAAKPSASSSTQRLLSRTQHRVDNFRSVFNNALLRAASLKAKESPYTALDPERREVRLLSLAPGRFKSDLVINLRVVTLDHLPEYDALSYAWETEISPKKAFVNGVRMRLGANLDSGLRHLRYSHADPKLLWVDAVCINQMDVEERNSQVSMMRDIYSLAKHVDVWLGPERADDEEALDWIQSGQAPDEETFEQVARLCISVCERSWFRRLWVFQELALAREDPILHLGRKTVLWSELYHFSKTVFILGFRRGFLEAAHGDLQERLILSIRCVSDLEFGRIGVSFGGGFAAKLRNSSYVLASDPRDRVFALLGISQFDQRQHSILPDYSKSVQRVFAEATISALQESAGIIYHRLPLYPLSEYDGQPLPDVPSWTLDLRISTQGPNLWTANIPSLLVKENAKIEESLLQGIQHIPLRLTASHAFTRLHTIGTHLGTICNLASWAEGQYQSELVVEIVRDIFASCMRSRGIPASKLLKAMKRDGQDLDNHQLAQISAQFESFLDSAMASTSECPIYFPLACILFLTDHDHVGVAYHPDLENGIRPGDKLVGLFGINYPMILRPVQGGLDGAPAYTMINVCHVAEHELGHDFLKDTKPDARWEDFEEFGLEKYTIV